MSIDKVEITNVRGDLLTLTLGDISNGFIVKEIDGLGPVKANIVGSSFANMPGQQKQSSNRDARNISIKLGYAPNFGINETVLALRSRLYQIFMTSSDVEMVFYMSDGLTARTSGTVESCEPDMFTQEPQMAISIFCYDPDFIDVELSHIYGPMVITDTEPYEIDYRGTSPTGVIAMGFYVAQNVSDFTIYQTTPAGDLRTMQVSVPLLVGDTVEFDSRRGNKRITLQRGGTPTSILWAVSPQSLWVELQPGVNQMYVHAAGATYPSVVWCDYFTRYGGL